MFARNVSLRLKPNTLKQFTTAFEREVLPILRKQDGFRDEIMLAVDSDATHVNAISLWDTREQADAYDMAIYPGIVQALDRFFDSPPKVRLTTVISSTLHSLASVLAAAPAA
jgi:hypothetical protein